MLTKINHFELEQGLNWIELFLEIYIYIYICIYIYISNIYQILASEGIFGHFCSRKGVYLHISLIKISFQKIGMLWVLISQV